MFRHTLILSKLKGLWRPDNRLNSSRQIMALKSSTGLDQRGGCVFSVSPFSSKMPGEAIVLKYAKLSEKAYDPVKGSEHAAGFDLRSAYNYTVKAHGKELVKTDLQVQVPKGCYGRVAPRSGLAWKNFIDVGAGVIDIDYTGNLGVVIFNHGEIDFIINEGDRVAQLICEKIEYPVLQEVKNLDATQRGSGGFGSTGTS